MSGWCDAAALAAHRAPGGQVAERLGDIAPHDAAFRGLFTCLLAGLIGGLLVALVALSPPGTPAAARRVVLAFAAGSGALATVLAAVLGRPWPAVAALAVLAGVARDGSRRWLPTGVAVLVAVLAVVEPATVFAPLGGLAAYGMARLATRASGDVVTEPIRDRAVPLVAVALILVAAAGLRPPPATVPEPVLRTGAVADLTVSLLQTGGAVTVLAASGRRPPPAPIDQVSLDLGGRAVALLPGTSGRYAGTADLPAAGSAVRATVTVRRAGERLTVPFAWTAPPPSPSPSRLPVALLLALAVLALAAVHRKIPKDVP